MPSDWKIGTIHDLAKDVICGKTPSTKKSEYYGFEIPFITIPDMHGKTYIVTTEVICPNSEQVYNQKKVCLKIQYV